MDPLPAEPTFSIERFRGLLKTAWLGRELIYEPMVSSTMDVVRSLAQAGSANGTVVAAEEQTAGRGRLGRRWIAPAGVNLAFSILLRPSLSQLKSLSMIAPLAVVQSVRSVCGLEAAIKWPNDVQLGGRKLAGILLESELSGDRPSFAIAGIGINVNFDIAKEPQIADIATSLLRQTGRLHEREEVLAACLEAFERIYEASARETYASWRAHLSTLGRQIRVSVGGVVEEGLAEDAGSDGSLILRRADGTRLSLPAGEVSLRTSQAPNL